MAKFVINLKDVMDVSTRDYISTNVDKFKSTTPGPKGDDGLRGPQGVGVHHMKGTSTTDPEGDFSTAGEYDTYTFYADAHEEFPLAWFTIKKGEDPWRRAVDRGYRGTEEEFYTLLGMVEEYAMISLEAMEVTRENREQVALDAAKVAEDRIAVAADRVIVVDAKAIVIAAKDATVESADTVQEIFLGTKVSDPMVDNQGNALVTGVMYFNSTTGTLRIWTGTVWSLGAFSVAGAVVSVNGRDGAVELTKADVGLGNVTNESKTTMFHDPVFTGTVTGVTASAVGLGNVTNESKGTMFTSPTFIGIPTATTAAVGDATTRIATTAFVVNEINKVEEW